ncbi:MAG TPA: hypothetical protein VNM38_13065 [Solirubrobacterales bacterium]|nr:hypothetical protein [Solirubrobacterales bacterium]
MRARRGRWTDARLDDLNKKVDGGFARVDADIRELRGEMRGGFDRFDKKFDRLTLALLVTVASAILTHHF